MVFWFYVGLMLTVPPLLYGLALGVVYLYVRWKRLLWWAPGESGERSAR